MDEYISKEEALNEIRRKCICGHLPFRSNTPEGIMILEAIRVIDSMPAADVRPVVRGEWEPGDCNCPVCKENKFKGLDADIWADWQPPFCPNCGADMRGDKEK